MNRGGTALEAPNATDTGLPALKAAASILGVTIDTEVLVHDLGLSQRDITSRDMARVAQTAGLRAKLLTDQSNRRLELAATPAVVRMRDGRYFVFRRTSDGKPRLIHPRTLDSVVLPMGDLCADWSGEILLLARRVEPLERRERFDFGWFLSAAVKYRRALIDVLLASVFVQIFGLLAPLCFQIVIDKVLTHHSTSTLYLIVLALVVMAVFDVTLQYLRSYALYYTASRIDVDLGAGLFKRLFSLPLSYFETRPAGQTVARVREVENIRSFLTGSGLTSVIDLLFACIYLAILWLYSVTLTVAVVVSIPAYVLVAALIRPLLRARILERFQRGAASQQFLVESVVGAYTLKAAAVEPLAQRQWEERLATYVKASFDAVMLANLGQNGIQLVSKVLTAAILLLGAEAVIAGNMTVGALVAFNMIATQLVSPILRLSQLWQDFQQVQVSVERVGDIFNFPPEEDRPAAASPPSIVGSIELQHVSFRYRPDTQVVLDHIDLEIPIGQVIGIVGPSGSGKSTLTKVIQRLCLPQEGRVLIDGVDIRQVHPAWFRRQIGVVLQENLLFNRTIHENIALADPTCSRERVIELSRLAGAHEFISELPRAYDTPIEERGANLSGGQRQRIAIARALTRDPRILILDEATSALDYESERLIQENMTQIVRNRTVIIIAHRLAAVRGCDRIIGMNRGCIVEEGTHEQLLARTAGLYARLWALQSETAAGWRGAA